jgi:hypothetical protein
MTQHNGTQHNDNLHKDTQRNYTQRNDTQHNDNLNNDNQRNDILHNGNLHNDTSFNKYNSVMNYFIINCRNLRKGPQKEITIMMKVGSKGLIYKLFGSSFPL